MIVDVTVKDKSGKPIENLKQEDFTVLEDGKPQKISVFEFQKLAMDRQGAGHGLARPAKEDESRHQARYGPLACARGSE